MITKSEACQMQVKVRVRGESETQTKMEVKAGKFSLTIDEPENMGGENAVPSPVQVLLMALAGCLNVTGHQIAKEKNLSLKKINITIDGDMNACTFVGCSAEERAGFQKIKIKIKPKFNTKIEQKLLEEWIKETEERCPVTDNIKSSTEILIENQYK